MNNEKKMDEIRSVIVSKKPDFRTLLRSQWMSNSSFVDDLNYIKAYYEDEKLVKEFDVYNKQNNEMALNLSVRASDFDLFNKIVNNCREEKIKIDLLYVQPNKNYFGSQDLILSIAQLVQEKPDSIFNAKLKDKRSFINAVLNNWDFHESYDFENFFDFINIMNIKPHKRKDKTAEIKMFFELDFKKLDYFFKRCKYDKKGIADAIEDFFSFYDEQYFTGNNVDKFFSFKNECEIYKKKISLESFLEDSTGGIIKQKNSMRMKI